MTSLSQLERRNAVNNVMLDALSAYYNWVKEYEQRQLLASQVKNAEGRYKLVRGEVEQGARPAIDTLEALAQLLSLQQQLTNANLQVKNSAADLSAYLWFENGTPYLLPENTVPDSAALLPGKASITDLDNALALVDGHPKLLAMDTKLGILTLERKLKMQNLVPMLSVNAVALSKKSFPGYGDAGTVSDNFKVNLDFSVPLFLRTARGAYRSAGFKLQETQLERNNLHWELTLKMRKYFNELSALEQQIRDFSRAQVAYMALFNGEVVKFSSGESSLFLVNSRELKVLETSQKLIELKAKQQKVYAGLLHSAGMLI
ncbi:MAG: TolC family protein [Chitinophagia bacterium]|nr:TolC family protein [Chitinophagia bacterium]